MTRLDDSAQGWSNKLQNKSVGGLILWVVGMLIVVVIGISAIGFAFSWFGAAASVISPTNVRAQFALAYDDYEALGKLTDTMCLTKQAVVQETDPNAKTQRRTQLLAYEAQYNRVAADYQARYDDAFRAALVGPKDLPKKIAAVSTVVAGC